MRKLNNLYDDICNIDNIIIITDKVCSKVKNKEKVSKYELYKSEHIINIKKD